MEEQRKNWIALKKFNSSVGANEENRFHHQPSPTPCPSDARLCVREAVAKPQAAVSLFALEDEA